MRLVWIFTATLMLSGQLVEVSAMELVQCKGYIDLLQESHATDQYYSKLMADVKSGKLSSAQLASDMPKLSEHMTEFQRFRLAKLAAQDDKFLFVSNFIADFNLTAAHENTIAHIAASGDSWSPHYLGQYKQLTHDERLSVIKKRAKIAHPHFIKSLHEYGLSHEENYKMARTWAKHVDQQQEHTYRDLRAFGFSTKEADEIIDFRRQAKRRARQK
jgi:hypothetical protein